MLLSKSEKYGDFVIGNVQDIEKLSDVKNNANYLRIKASYDKRKQKCKQTCRYYSVCGSSFLSNAYSESNTLIQTENIGCILNDPEIIKNTKNIIQSQRDFFKDYSFKNYLITVIEPNNINSKIASMGGIALHNSFAAYFSQGIAK